MRGSVPAGARAPLLPRRVVALGGGTGLPAVLGGMRQFLSNNDATALTAVVTMSDDGGSSGRLRRTRGMPPPGDVRNCLVALSAESNLLAGLFQHRYGGAEGELGGHKLGNLILAALAEQTGSFLRAVEVSSRVLRTVGRILPATLEDVTLRAELEDGSTLIGESAIGACRKRIRRVSLEPGCVQPTPGVAEAVLDADLVVLGPGSLFTSLVPNLLIDEVRHALVTTRAVRILVGNLVSERGEASGLRHRDHLQVIDDHVGERVIDGLLAHEGAVGDAIVRRYLGEAASPLTPPREDITGVRTSRRDLVAQGPKLRHAPQATATGLNELWREIVTARTARQQRPVPAPPVESRTPSR